MRSRLHPFVLALSVAVGTAGVMTSAQSIEEFEKIAGPEFDLEDSVDEIGPGGGAAHVSGHGNFFAPASGGPTKEKEILQDISFSFHGIATGMEGEAKGQFEFHTQTSGGADLTVHGEVLCVSVNDNTATLLGVVTRSNDASLDVNATVTWVTQDNGEGSSALPDTVSRPSKLNQKLPLVKGTCGFQKQKLSPEDIVSGNIQVDDDETSGGKPTTLQDKDPGDVSKESYGVSGHGNFFDGGKKIVQDISFSFHAIGTDELGKFVNDVAKGQFEYHDQTGGGQPLDVHGEVICAAISDNFARLIGVVTNSNDKGLLPGTLVGWSAQDNGEGGSDAPDLISRLEPIGVKLPKDVCQGKLPAQKLLPVLGGNIQIH